MLRAVHTCLSAICFIVLSLILVSSGVEGSIQCYDCTGSSGHRDPTLPNSYCGLPFKDNSTNPLITVTCEGACVTHTIYNGDSIPISTTIRRTCSDAPVSDGCVYSEQSGVQKWSCIKTCTTDKCNTGSDGTTLVPPTVVQLLVLAIASISAYFKSSVLSQDGFQHACFMEDLIGKKVAFKRDILQTEAALHTAPAISAPELIVSPVRIQPSARSRIHPPHSCPLLGVMAIVFFSGNKR